MTQALACCGNMHRIASRYNLTTSGYADWKILYRKVEQAERMFSILRSRRSCIELNNAERALRAFEKRHGLTGERRPLDFCL